MFDPVEQMKVKTHLKTKKKDQKNKIKDLIRSITNNSDNFDEKYMKIKFDTDDYLPLKKALELYNMFFMMAPTNINKFFSWMSV